MDQTTGNVYVIGICTNGCKNVRSRGVLESRRSLGPLKVFDYLPLQSWINEVDPSGDATC